MIKWIVRSNKYPNNPVPVADEEEAKKMIRQYQNIIQGYRTKVHWEYGTYDPAEPNSYRKVGPR